jgi:ketopantoate reductase
MHVAIVGAGALGRIYGVRLARAGVDVSFVVRDPEKAVREPFAIEIVGGTRGPEVLEAPRLVARVPEDVDIVLVAVRFEQLASLDLVDRVRVAAPLVVLTPMFPAQRLFLVERVGERVVAAMPGAVGYTDARGIIRAWIPSLAPTLIDDRRPVIGRSQVVRVVEALAEQLDRSGLPTRLERDVLALNTATTIAFFPLIAAIAAGGGALGLASDTALLALTARATAACRAIARREGRIAPWAEVLARLAGTPRLLRSALRAGVVLGRAIAPEPLAFVDGHFAVKLEAQHRAMAEAIIQLEPSGHVDALDAIVSWQSDR